MPNKMSEDVRRANFILPKDDYKALETRALYERVSVGELIRRALEDTYDLRPQRPVISIRPLIGQRHLSPETNRGRVTKSRRTAAERRPRPAEKPRRHGVALTA